MDLFSIKTVKELLKQQETRPRKGLGQNFLTSKGVLGDILKAAQLTKQDTVLEIGPGIGTLTRELALATKKVIAVEKDPAMVEILRKTTRDLPNIEIICADILKLGETTFPKPGLGAPKPGLGKAYKVVANLPYYITSPVIRMFLEVEEKPDLLVLMVQKEVAQRICAKPRTRAGSVQGRPPMNLLAVSVQFYAEPKIVSYVPRSCFWPQPKVDSAILKLNPIKENPTEHTKLNRIKFFTVVKAGFKQPRKQLVNNLSHGLSIERRGVEQWLKKNNINLTQRAETLSIQDWMNLTKSLPAKTKPGLGVDN